MMVEEVPRGLLMDWRRHKRSHGSYFLTVCLVLMAGWKKTGLGSQAWCIPRLEVSRKGCQGSIRYEVNE